MNPPDKFLIQDASDCHSVLRHTLAFCMVSLMINLPVHAQSASFFNKHPTKPAKTEAPAPEVNAKPDEILASRYVTGDALPSHLKSLGEILSIRKRETDPFGKHQDPDGRPVIKPTVSKLNRFTPAQTTPFSDIVRLIKVTTVMPSERSFLIGTRTITEGDRIPLSFRGRTIKVEIAAVTSRSIEFRNTENGEQASLKLNMLPVGMTPGNDGITAPGMTPDGPDAPINLDSGSL